MSAKRTKHTHPPERPGELKADWARFDAMTEEEIMATSQSQLADLPDGFWDDAVMARAKEPISLRADHDVLQWFRGGGRGYQTRMNAVPRIYMEKMREG